MAELIKSCHAVRGTFTVTGYATSSVPFTINMAAGQTANALEIKTSTGVPVYWITPSGDVHYIGDEYVTDHLTVNGGATIGDTLSVTNLATVGSLISTGNATVGGVLNVTGNSTFSSAVLIQNNLTVNGGFTTTGTVLFPNGTATAPSISFTGDPDTGFYWASANNLGITSGGTVKGSFAGQFFYDSMYSQTATTLTLKGQVADGASAVGATIGSYNTLANASSKLVSFVNNTTEKLSIAYDGSLTSLGSLLGTTIYSSAGVVSAQNAGTNLTVRGKPTEGATAIAVNFDSGTALVTAGAKIANFTNNTAEKAAIGLAGEVMAGVGTNALPSLSFLGDPDTGFYNVSTGIIGVSSNGTNGIQFGSSAVYGRYYLTLGATAATLSGAIADGASAVGVIIDNSVSLTTSGAKLVSFRNATVEKAYLDCQGKLSIGDSSPLYLYPQERTPGACVAGTPSAGGSVTDGTHSYKVTFVTAEGESTPSAKSNVITCGAGNNTVALTGIAIGGARVTARKIYRTDAGDAGDWKLVATIANNTDTTASDTAADAGGAAAPTVNTTTNLFVSAVADSATAIGFVANSAALSTAGSKIWSWQNNGTEKAYLTKDGKAYFATGGIQTIKSVANVSAPPTDAELDSAFGDPTVVGSGFIGIVDDNDAGTDCYICWTTGTAGEWFYLAGTKAL
ncbi:MAG: hypothetical protein WC479_11400 [Candidatus Izemoplasmatales bacterium]